MFGFMDFIKNKKQYSRTQPVIFAIDVSEKMSNQCVNQIYSSLRLSLDKFSDYNRYSSSLLHLKLV